MKELEHDANLVCHQILEKLDRSFITPFDREDIHALAVGLGDVVDSIESSASPSRPRT
jgi:hypothetical protein